MFRLAHVCPVRWNSGTGGRATGTNLQGSAGEEKIKTLFQTGAYSAMGAPHWPVCDGRIRDCLGRGGLVRRAGLPRIPAAQTCCEFGKWQP